MKKHIRDYYGHSTHKGKPPPCTMSDDIHTNENGPNTDPTPSIEVLKNTLTEEVSKHLGGNMRATRKIHGFNATSALKPSELKKVAQIVKVDNISQQVIREAIGAGHIIIASADKRQTPIMISEVLNAALNSNRVALALTSYLSVVESENMTKAEIENRGSYAEKIKNTTIEPQVAAAFGLGAESIIEVIEVNPDNYHGSKLNPIETGAIGEMRYAGVKVMSHTLENTSLTVNAQTIHQTPLGIPAYACRIKSGGCGKQSGSNQVRHAKGCPACGLPKSRLIPSCVALTLPLLVDSGEVGKVETQVGRSKVGQLEFRTCRLKQNIANVLLDNKEGLTTGEDSIKTLIGMQVNKMRFNHRGVTHWVSASVVPVVFDVLGHGIFMGLGLRMTRV